VSWPLLKPYLGECCDKLDRFCPNGSFGGGGTTTSGGCAGVVVGLPHDNDAGISSIQEVDFILCDDSLVSPKVTIKNHGNDPVDSVLVNWQWDNGPVSSTLFIGTLTSLQTANFSLPAIAAPAGNHDLRVFTTNPNGFADQNFVNDTSVIKVIAYLPSIDIVFDVWPDDFGSETTWELVDDSGTLLHSGGPYNDGAAGTLVRTIWCLGTGCYELTVRDLFGDGMCCAQGNGSYSVYDALPTGYVSGNGQFANAITHQFCLTSVGVEEVSQTELTMYPNPTSGLVNVNVTSDLVGSTLNVYNTLGAVVLNERISTSGLHTIDLSDLNSGIYVVELSSNEQRRFGRIIKE